MVGLGVGGMLEVAQSGSYIVCPVLAVVDALAMERDLA